MTTSHLIDQQRDPISYTMTRADEIRRSYIRREIKSSAYFLAIAELLNSEVASRAKESTRRMIRSNYNIDMRKAQQMHGVEKISENAAKYGFPLSV